MSHLKLDFKTPISFSTLFSFFFLITIICVLSYSDEEGAYMLKLLHALDSPPFDWSNNTQPCSWSGVSCGKSSNVQEINLGSMSLKGVVPSGLNNSLIFLTKLDLSNNAFHGPLPSLANIDKLQDVDLSDNNFTSIPEGCFQGLVSLQNLYLGNNIHLTPWKFPTDLVDSSPLKYFDFRATNLMGSLPDIFDSFPNLQGVVLSNNNLSGVLPKSFARSKIYILFLNDQNLSGTIEILSSMTSLSWVWLQGNRFEGPIPNLSNCTKLQYLWLQDNRLAGAVPSSLVSLSRLHEAFLDNNYLRGPLPMFGRNNVTVSLGANNIFLEISASFGYPIVLTPSWTGNNPCKGWSFISCEGTKIRTVNLTRLNLTGNISPKFGNLSDLWNLYLGDNNLWGEIPESLATLAQLKVLDVSNNGLSGNIPIFSPRVRLSTKGNANLQSPSADSGHSPGPSAVSGLSPSPSTDSGSPSPSADSGLSPSPSIDFGHRRSPSAVSPLLITGAAAAGVGVFVISIVVIYNRKRCLSLIQKMMFMKTITFIDNNFEDFMPSYGPLTLKRYNYSEVKKMTNSFRNKLGQGGYGTVYKATLIDGRQVAVKVLGESNGSGEEFINEVASIRRTSHVNIVSLLGFCYEKKKRALIYEFMPNGSLDKFIYKKGSPNAICDLDWSTLFQITISIARGLEYLHHGCNTRILHLDIKPQNILLDEDFCPKIADFGLAKICKKRESIVSILGTRGTPGYIAPEVFSRIYGGVSHKSDVYSYGMLIIEVVGGRENYDNGGSCTSEAYFPDWIYKDLEQGNIPSRCLANTDEDNDMIMKITLVSLWCIQANPSNRPSMNKVVEMLEGPLQLVPYPPKPILHSPEKSLIRFSDISYSNTQETNSIIAEENGSIKENEFT